MKRITFLIEPELFRDFKKICLDKDVTMSEVLVRIVKSYIRKNKIN